MAMRWSQRTWANVCTLGAVAATTAALTTIAPADNPRTAGRAGVALIVDDSSAVVMTNPAALTRRADLRIDVAWLQTSLHQTQTTDGARTIGVAMPGSHLALGVVWGHGRTVLGWAGSVETTHEQFPVPDIAQPAPQIAQQFFYRYQAFGVDRTTTRMQMGAAYRLSDYVALGAAIGIAATDMRQQQFIWAGRPERDVLLASEYDISVSWYGKSLLQTHAALGLLAATKGPWEFALAAQLATPVNSRAMVDAIATSPLVAIEADDASAKLHTDGDARVAAGARWLHDSWSIETNIGWQSVRTTTHRLQGLVVADTIGRASVPAMTTNETPATLHAGISGDWMAVDGFLWLTGGLRVAAATTTAAGVDADPAYRGAFGIESMAAPYTLAVGIQIDHANQTINATVITPFAADISAPATNTKTWQVTAGLMVERSW